MNDSDYQSTSLSEILPNNNEINLGLFCLSPGYIKDRTISHDNLQPYTYCVEEKTIKGQFGTHDI